MPQTHISKTNVNAAVQSKTIFRGSMNAANFTTENKEQQICFRSHTATSAEVENLCRNVQILYWKIERWNQMWAGKRPVIKNGYFTYIWDTCFYVSCPVKSVSTDSKQNLVLQMNGTCLLHNTDFAGIVISFVHHHIQKAVHHRTNKAQICQSSPKT